MPSQTLLNSVGGWGAKFMQSLLEGLVGSFDNSLPIWYDNKTHNEGVISMAGEFSQRVSFTVSKELEEAMRESAWKNRQNVSEWLREAISAKLQLEAVRKRKP